MTSYCSKCGSTTEQRAENLLICENDHETYLNQVVGAVVFVFKNDQVLYGIRDIEPNKGRLNAPGGFVELTETAEQAAIRETKEEMGIDIKLVDILGTYSTLYGSRNILNVVFVGNVTDGEAKAGDDMTADSVEWRAIDDLPKEDELAWRWYGQAQVDLQRWYKQNGRGL